MKVLKKTLLNQALVIAIFSISDVFAACSVASGGDANINVSLDHPLSLGKVVSPDQGEETYVEVAANGVRQIPQNYMIGSKNTSGFGDQFQAARLSITGSPDCKFRVSVISQPSAVSNVTLQGIGGTLLNSAYSGAEGILSSMGTAVIQVGAKIKITGNNTDDIAGQIMLDVAFVASDSTGG